MGRGLLLSLLAWSGLPGALAWLSEQTLAGCSYEVVMVDDRPLPRSARGIQTNHYWAMTAVINYAYTAHWGYSFRYVRVNSSVMREYRPTWGKVFYLAERLRQHFADEVGRQHCKWFLYLDGDAFIRELNVPLPVFLASLGSRYLIKRNVGAIFAQEEDLDMGSGLRGAMRGYNPKVPWLNTGVLFMQANHNGRLLMSAWEAAAFAASPKLRSSWPGEQGVVTELLLPGTYPGASTPLARRPDGLNRTLATVELTEFNSPWGRFAAHLWGHHSYMRENGLWDGMIRLGLHAPKALAEIYPKVLQRVEPWVPGPKVRQRGHVRSSRTV